MGPFGTGLVAGGLLSLYVDEVFPGGQCLCLVFVVAMATVGGPPLITK